MSFGNLRACPMLYESLNVQFSSIFDSHTYMYIYHITHCLYVCCDTHTRTHNIYTGLSCAQQLFRLHKIVAAIEHEQDFAHRCIFLAHPPLSEIGKLSSLGESTQDMLLCTALVRMSKKPIFFSDLVVKYSNLIVEILWFHTAHTMRCMRLFYC